MDDGWNSNREDAHDTRVAMNMRLLVVRVNNWQYGCGGMKKNHSGGQCQRFVNTDVGVPQGVASCDADQL